MPTYLLRLDAVNFASSCYDTNDLSTIRGGSMMLSNAHQFRQITDSTFDKDIDSYFRDVTTFNDLSELSVRAKLLHLVALWDYVA